MTSCQASVWGFRNKPVMMVKIQLVMMIFDAYDDDEDDDEGGIVVVEWVTTSMTTTLAATH